MKKLVLAIVVLFTFITVFAQKFDQLAKTLLYPSFATRGEWC